MRRRELLSAIFSSLAGMLPFQSRACAPERSSARELQEQLATMAAERAYLVQRGEELFSHLQCFACTISRENKHQEQIFSLISAMRAPLAAIDMTIQIMFSSDEHDISDKFRTYLEDNSTSCQLLVGLINEVFALARSRQEAISTNIW